MPDDQNNDQPNASPKDEGYLPALQDALKSHQEADPAPAAPEATAVEPAPVEADDRPRDEHGRFAPKTQDEPKAEASPEDDFDPPEHWPAADKERIKTLPAEHRKWLAEKRKDIERNAETKLQEAGRIRKEVEHYQEFDRVLAPVREGLAMAGIRPAQFVERMIAIGMRYERDPEGTIRYLAQQKGLDLGALANSDATGYVDPQIQATQAELQALRGQVQQLGGFLQNTQHQQALSGLQQTWEAFAQANEAGEPKYPGADRLLHRITDEIARMPPEKRQSTPRADLLVEAYEAVKWTDPEVRRLIREKESRQSEERRKAEVEKARAASVNTRATPLTSGGQPVPAKGYLGELQRVAQERSRR